MTMVNRPAGPPESGRRCGPASRRRAVGSTVTPFPGAGETDRIPLASRPAVRSGAGGHRTGAGADPLL
ncbi:hypothetical protein SGRIM128S_04896 [Streptomyces griseomycini]